VDEDGIELIGYLRERHRTDSGSLGDALIELCARRRTAFSVLVRGVQGFGAGRSRSGRSLPLGENPPLTVTAVDTQGNIEALLAEPLLIAQPWLVTLEAVRLLTDEMDPVWLGENSAEATRLTMYCWRRERAYEVPAFEAACDLLYRRGIAGATVLPGVDGTYLGRRQRAQFLNHGADAPLALTAVGAGDRIAMLLPELGGLFRHPVMTVAKVGLCKRDGQVISRPQLAHAGDAPGSAPADMTALVKLTVYTSEAARHDGHPVHQVIVRRLRSAGLSGATSVRGIWGFHRDQAPHGDHFPHRGHHLPIVTTVVDTPERISAAFDVIDPLTPDRGLVTAETVLTSRHSPVPFDRLRETTLPSVPPAHDGGVTTGQSPPQSPRPRRSACRGGMRPGGPTAVASRPRPRRRTTGSRAGRASSQRPRPRRRCSADAAAGLRRIPGDDRPAVLHTRAGDHPRQPVLHGRVRDAEQGGEPAEQQQDPREPARQMSEQRERPPQAVKPDVDAHARQRHHQKQAGQPVHGEAAAPTPQPARNRGRAGASLRAGATGAGMETFLRQAAAGCPSRAGRYQRRRRSCP